MRCLFFFIALASIAHAQTGSWARGRLSHCHRGDPHACAQAAYAFRVGQGAPRNPLVALRLFARSWSLQRTPTISLALYETVRGQRFPPEAHDILDPICTAGSAYACAATALIDMQRARTSIEREAARSRLAGACAAGAAQACYDLRARTTGRLGKDPAAPKVPLIGPKPRRQRGGG